MLPADSLAQQPEKTKQLDPAPSAAGEAADLLAVTRVTPSRGLALQGTAAKPAAKLLAGNVVDEWGKPLMGATVMILGDKEHSVSTNSEGNYLLPTTTAAPVVQVSFAGYVAAERVARSQADLLFKLEPIKGYKRDLKKRSKAAARAWQH
ncbi:hypothetical protein GCM10011378_17670 [Hymenobacter glacieicola]|uniref:TonB-dependent receptor plug domain-containing protein n=1 Tax=Hymenobacter glacieicola TaxID=1562124 RepID=A0ABQ1WQZ2_9BACT|nr:hypothetical protein GCM10011378_17670 [Hymenobacter glacieicola]